MINESAEQIFIHHSALIIQHLLGKEAPHGREQPGIGASVQKRRIKIAFLFILACYVGLMARLLYLQVVHGAEIRTRSPNRAANAKSSCPRAKAPLLTAMDARLAASLYTGEVGFDPLVTLHGRQGRQNRAQN